MPQTPQSPSNQLTKAVINEEEARTELLATLAAARELGPEMDDTLASRFADRFSALFPDPTRDLTRLRGDVETLIVSARGHGADADPARAKDFLARALAPKPAPPAVAPQAGLPARGQYAPYIPMILAAAVVIAIVVASHGYAFWLLFALPWMFFGGRRGRRMRYRRYGPWDNMGPGLPPGSSRRQLPPGDEPEML